MPNCSWYWLVGISCWLVNSTLNMTLAAADFYSESCKTHWNNCELISTYSVLFFETLWLCNAINLISFQNGARPCSIKSTLFGIRLHANEFDIRSIQLSTFQGFLQGWTPASFLISFLERTDTPLSVHKTTALIAMMSPQVCWIYYSSNWRIWLTENYISNTCHDNSYHRIHRHF